MSFQFDIYNFGLGFGAGILSTMAGMRAIRAAKNMRQSFTPRFQEDTYATKRGDKRYARDLIDWAQTAHLLGNRIQLTDMLIEPRFIKGPALVSMPDVEDAARDVWEVVPQVHEYPHLYGAFNLPTLSIDDLSKGDKAIALLGNAGSGRTTALLAIALWSMGQIDFKPPLDAVQQEINEQESDLTPEEMGERIKNRVRMAQQARLRVAQLQGRAEYTIEDAEAEEKAESKRISKFRNSAPIYIHLANVNLKNGGWGNKIDPAEPIVRAVQAQVGRLSSRIVPGGLYRMISAGRATILIDGFDDIPEDDHEIVKAWIRALIDIHGKNYIVMVAPPTGYGWMQSAGFMPVFLRPWTAINVEDTADKWLVKWDTITGSPLPPDDAHADLIRYNTHSLTPFQITLKTWSTLVGRLDTNESDWADYYLRQNIPDYDGLRATLQQLAQIQLDSGYITLSQAVQAEIATPTIVLTSADDADGASPVETIPATTEAPPAIPIEDETAPTSETPDFSDGEGLPVSEDSDGLSEFYARAEPVAPPPLESKQPERSEAQIRRTLSRLINDLVKRRILIDYNYHRYQFNHPLIAAYLGGLALTKQDEITLRERATRPAWHHAIGYASQHVDIDVAVHEQLKTPDDLIYDNMLRLTDWLGYAHTAASWRNNLLRFLGNMLVAPSQYTFIRERIASALVSSRDEGALVILRRTLQHPNPDIRRLGCLGLGAMRDMPAVKPLINILNDEEPDVQIAAAIALGTIATDESLFAIVDVMQTSPDKDVRRAIAETLAGNPHQGYITLYDAINESDSDIMLRRAVLFGLGRIKTDWALITINEVLSNPNEEYYVRSAATDVFDNLYQEEIQGVRVYPQVGAVPWLLDWSQEPIENGEIPPDIEGIELLKVALTQHDNPIARVLATQTAAQLNVWETTRDIYQRLTDDVELVRDIAFRSLAEIQLKTGQALPPPTA